MFKKIKVFIERWKYKRWKPQKPDEVIFSLEKYTFLDGVSYLLDYPKAGIHAFYGSKEYAINDFKKAFEDYG